MLYSTSQAARYLGLSLASLKYHVFVAKNLSGEKIGNSLVFRQAELDRFAANRRPPGRPRKEQK